MIWTISEHDAVRGVVEFFRVAAGLVATTLRVEIADGEDGASEVGITYVITPLTDEGAVFAATRYEPETLRRAMRWWGTSMTLPAHWRMPP